MVVVSVRFAPDTTKVSIFKIKLSVDFDIEIFYYEGDLRFYTYNNDTTHGDFDEWMFSNLGIFGFVGELYMDNQVQFRKKGGDEKPDPNLDDDPDDLERQKFNDRLTQGAMFKDWKKFNIVHGIFAKY